MFVDASALVAMAMDEPERHRFADLLESASGAVTSPIAAFEAALAIARILRLAPEDAEREVQTLLALANIAIVAIPAEALPLAVAAFARYGKGRGHPAQLNMGDCFSYACARHFGLPLLYKGDDFAHTDIDAATRRR